MLIILRWSASKSGVVLLLSLATGFIFFQTPLETALVGMGKGLWDALVILLVVWAALIFYQVTFQSGAFTSIRKGIQKYNENYLFLILAFGWVLTSFLQSIAGLERLSLS